VNDATAIHAWAWLVWVGAIVTITARTRNPWYLVLTLLWVIVTELAARRQPLLGRSAPLWSPLRFGLFVIPITAIFNALTVHVGAIELGRLPLSWPLLGGPITLEAMLYGALNGLALTTLFGAFAVINRMLPLRAIIHLIPRTYYPVAVVTLQQWQQIREAQAIRGHHLRGARSWLALWLPLLTGGMERALQLAEAMTARGFAGGAVQHTPLLLLYTVWGQAWMGLLVMAVGGALVLGVLRAVGRQHPHTRYRPMEWKMRDWIVVGGALVTALAFLLPIPGHTTIYYTPYPALTPPPFALTLGIASWGLLAPAAIWLMTTKGNL
jgi:energy-coupling factor transport system permease protein